MTPKILEKLTNLLDCEIIGEIEVVYLLACIRKIIEQDKLHETYPNLKFHCNWALHSSLDRKDAQSILKIFDEVHKIFCNKEEELTFEIRRKLENISGMVGFKEDLSLFFKKYNLPYTFLNNLDGWVRFLHLYCKVIEDSSLIVIDGQLNLEKVVISLEEAGILIHGQQFYKINWHVVGKDGKTGTYFVINGFDVES